MSARVQRGAAGKCVYAAIVALAIAGYMVLRMFRQGMAGFDSFTLFMALAGVVAMLIVAPGKFTPSVNKPPWQGQRSFEEQSDPPSDEPKN